MLFGPRIETAMHRQSCTNAEIVMPCSAGQHYTQGPKNAEAAPYSTAQHTAGHSQHSKAPQYSIAQLEKARGTAEGCKAGAGGQSWAGVGYLEGYG